MIIRGVCVKQILLFPVSPRILCCFPVLPRSSCLAFAQLCTTYSAGGKRNGRFLCPSLETRGPMSWFFVPVFGSKVVFSQMPSWPGQQLLSPHGVSCYLQSLLEGLAKCRGPSLKNSTLGPKQPLLRFWQDYLCRREGNRTSFRRFVH